MASAITSHKIQGQTVAKPNPMVIDIETAFQVGMVYVMLSRVCSLQQLFILNKVNRDKIKVCPAVLKEYQRMNKASVNHNPSSWNNTEKLGTRICSFNVRSLNKHIEDVRSDNIIIQSDIICLQETWLEKGIDNELYKMTGYKLHLNSQGRGKGMAIYMKEEKFKHIKDVSTPNLQISLMSSKEVDVITIYKSQEESSISTRDHIKAIVNPKKTTLIVGDFNFCYLTKTNIVTEHLRKQKFIQLVKDATHIEGSLLDQAYFRQIGKTEPPIIEQFSNYYSDHDTITVLIP